MPYSDDINIDSETHCELRESTARPFHLIYYTYAMKTIPTQPSTSAQHIGGKTQVSEDLFVSGEVTRMAKEYERM